MILFPAIAPYRYDELRMACDIIDSGNITSDMLMIFDRFFSNYKMAAILEFQEKKIKYVIRVNENYNFSKRFIESKKKSAVIDLFPSYAAIKSLREYKYKVSIATPVKVRLIRIKLPTGKIEVLMTNLWEEEGYAVDEFKLLYSLRWGVETNINFQKNILQLESLSGLSPLSVMQDFFATVFISNLHHLLLKPAQETINKTVIRKYPMKINNNKAFGKIKENLIHLFITFEPQNILKKLHDYFIKWILPIRNNRSFPRIRKNPQSKSKYRTFTNYKPTY